MSQSKFEGREATQDIIAVTAPACEKEVSVNVEICEQPKHPTQPSIFRVPQIIRSNKEDDYEPKLVSIGPYHHSKPSLQAMEKIKQQILDHLLSKAPNDSIHQYVKEIQDLEVKARSYYSEVIDMESCKFAKMLLLDSCFIIQLFIPNELMAQELKDPLNRSIWLKENLFQDLLLLENQLPYFILDHVLRILNIPGLANFRLHEHILERLDEMLLRFFDLGLSSMERKREADFLHRIIERFPNLWKDNTTASSTPQSMQVSSSTEPNQDFEADHLLHLLHERILRMPLRTKRTTASSSDRQLRQKPSLVVPTVTELVEAGVKLKVRKWNNFLGISFNKERGLLQIPTIQVDESTNLIIRNLIALEQFCTDVGMQITCYSIFMDSIIDTEKDVALLRQEGIIDRRLVNDKDIASVFNELCKGVTFDSDRNYLKVLFMEVNDYCDSRWNRWRAKLMHDYFSNPWMIISVIVAAVLLVLTISQTVFSVLSYTQQIHSSDKPHP